MKKIYSILAVLFLIATASFAQGNSFYDFTVKTIEGDNYDFSRLKGKKVMIVNTASKCGLTPQYEGLQELYEKYGGEDFVIVGFPANNFRSQEPGSNSEIREFCSRNYGVTFPMMSKISVKGDDIHPLYKWLTSKDLNGVEDSEISWNFQKYLIDEEGNLVKYLKPSTKPLSDDVLSWVSQ